MRKIVIGTAWISEFMHTRWVYAALNLRIPADYSVDWVKGIGWCNARRGIHFIEQALELDADLIVMLDADVIVPSEWLETMVKHMEHGCSVVASVFPMRGRSDPRFKPFEPMAWNVADRNVENNTGRLVPIDPNLGLQEVEFAALGASIFDAHLFRDLPKPWFHHEHEKDTYRAKGSTTDTILLRNLRLLGVKIYADPTMDVRHLQTFEIDHTFSDRFPEWEVGPV